MYFGEVGLLWRIVRFFHLSLEGSAQMVQTSNGVGPSPTAEVVVQFRFYWESTRSSGNATRAGGYDGWRYPFGLEL